MFLALLPSLISEISRPDAIIIDDNLIYGHISANIIPTKNKTEIAPIINAKSALAIDVKSHTILYAKNIDSQLAFASLTKLMVAIILTEEEDLNKIVTVSTNATKIDGSKANLKAGEKLSIYNLLEFLLISSSNDAAIALAEANSGSTKDFVEKMNIKAHMLGLNNTKFTNPVGLDDGIQKSSARDLVNLSLYAIKSPIIREIVKKDKIEIKSEDNITRQAYNTDKLLNSYLHVYGLKTGTTDDAGECVINLASDDHGHEILTIILNSKDRFQESKSLIDWSFNAYKW